MNENGYKKLLQETRVWYKSIGKVYCPALKADVLFNSAGFRHLLFNISDMPRPMEERIRRLRLVQYAPFILQTSIEVGWRRKMGEVEFILFQKHVTDAGSRTITVRTVVRKTSAGNHFYFSIMDVLGA